MITDVPLTIRPSPFKAATQSMLVPAGMTIAEILAGIPEACTAQFEVFGVVTFNGEVVPREYWRGFRVKADRGDRPVCLTAYLVVPQNGGQGPGGGKSTLAIVASLAVIAGTAWIGGGGIAAALSLGASSTFAAGGLGAAAASAAFGIAGTLAMSALAPPPLRQSTKRQEGANRTQPADYAGITGNPLEPLASIPTVLGEVMASPPHLIRPYTKMVANVVHAYACVGFAGAIDITDIRINGIDSGTLANVTTHTSETGGAQTLATENVFEVQPGEVLSGYQIDPDDDTGLILADQSTPTNSAPQYHYFRTFGIPDAVRIRLHFSGLGYFPDGSSPVNARVPMLIEVRAVGGGSWTNLPILWWVGLITQPWKTQITLSWGTSSGTLATPAGPSLPRPNHDANGRQGIGMAWAYNAGSDYTVDATNAVKNVAYDGDQGFIIHMSTATFPQTGEYEVRIKRGGVDNGLHSTTQDYFGVLTGATDTVPSGFVSQLEAVTEITVESFATVRDGLPLDTTDLSYIEVDATRVNIQSISALWCSKGNNLVAGVWQTAGTSRMQNPSSIYRHVLTNTDLNSEPLISSTLLEDAAGESLQTWYTFCNTNSMECNMIVDGRSVEEVLQIVAGCGHAAVRRSEKWGVIIEQDRSADPIVQLFSQRNTWGNSVRRVTPVPVINGLFVTYANEADDFAPDEEEVLIFAGDNVEAIQYPGITNQTRIQKRANLDLRQRQYRTQFYSFQTDMQGIVSQRGDLVGYMFDTIDEWKFDATINRVKFDGSGNATGLVLDSYVDIFAAAAGIGGSVGVAIHKLDGTFVTRTISTAGMTAATGEINDITFTSTISGLAGSDTDFIGAFVAIGQLNSEYRRCRVFEITWDQDLTCSITLVDDASSDIHPL